MTGELTPKPGETSAQFKERVLKAQSDLAAQRPQPSAPRIETPAEPPTVTTSTPNDTQPKVTVSVPSAPAPSSAEPAKPAAEVPQPTPSKEDKVDPLEWARNKGLKSPEDIARSLRTLETEFHRRNQVRPATPAPSAPPPPPEAYR